MDSHLYQAATQQNTQIKRLYQLAMAPGKPPVLANRLYVGLLILAALLLGGGLIFWVAANWQALSRLMRLVLIESALLLSVLVACFWVRGRIAALFCATLVLGGLLAFVGQTYQTGADAWQLFASWALLSLVWVALSRSDLMWSLWVLIAALGIVLWTGRLDPEDILWFDSGSLKHGLLNIGLWFLLTLVPAAVSCIPFLQVQKGIGWWSHRTALACALAVWSSIGIVQIIDLSDARTGWFLIVILSLVGLSLWVSLIGRFRDFTTTCLTVLAINSLFLAAVARILLDSDLGGLLLFGLVAVACLGSSVSILMKMQQRQRNSVSVPVTEVL